MELMPGFTPVNGNSVTLPVPSDTSLKMTGITNSSGWKEIINVQINDEPAYQWAGSGVQNNQVVGSYSAGPDPKATQVTVMMRFDAGDGRGPQPSQIGVWTYTADGLQGYIVAGQDGGGRPSGPAYWNTMVLIYWVPGY